MFKGLRAQRLLALFVVGALALNFPLLALWDVGGTADAVAGVPVVALALFGLWLLLIVVLAWVAEG